MKQKDIPKPSMSAWEVACVAKDIDNSPMRKKAFVEIGSRNGGSWYYFSQLMDSGATVIAVDLPGGPWGMEASSSKLKEVLSILNQQGYSSSAILGNSKDPDITQMVRDSVPDGIDVLLIDGDHSYEGIVSDLKTYAPMVRPGGMVIVHDCGYCGGTIGHLHPTGVATTKEVHRAFQEFANKKKSTVYQDTWGLGVVWITETEKGEA